MISHPPDLLRFPALAGLAALACCLRAADDAARMSTFGIVIHGGAGAIARAELTPELEAQYRAGLTQALDAGHAVLDRGGSSLDAVVAAIRILEDSPLFNAGHGAVLNAAGECELDASIMDGRTLAAGAVAGVRHIRNPIFLARDVMEKTAHVMLAGEGAEIFAKGLGYDLVPNEYFQTGRRRRQLEQAKELERQAAPVPAGKAPVTFITIDESKFGTVGAVALDRQGNLAAGTSTGGMTNKKFGRVGDSPIIGAGTYAANPTCAVSCTGHGEYFIRLAAAHNVATLVEYQRLPLEAAAAETIKRIRELGGTGGLIAIDRAGHVALPFNTPGMYRGFRLADGRRSVAIFGDGD